MKFIRLDKNNQVNGAGLRCVVWVSGCENYCDECHNPETWDYNFGHIWDTEDQTTLDQQLSSPEISGITLTGGDPMAPKNRDAAATFCAMVKNKYPGKTIWMYTGYLFEDLVGHGWLENVDVLIDGRYKKELNPGPGKAKWRGSTNQRVIDVKESLKQGCIVEYRDFNGKTITENERGN